jgi:mono/diheme cytochrome c family protein
MKAATLLPLALLSACDLSMDRQPRGEPQGSATLWPGGPPRQAPPAGTIARGGLARAAALASPPPLTPALLDRGQERYGIYCSVCHGARGSGDGMIVRRGFPPPPSFGEARLVASPPAYIVDVITHGHGVMYSYADRVEPADRWAIAAYVQALQRAGVPEPRR